MSIRLVTPNGQTNRQRDRQTDRQTDGRTELVKQHRALHALRADARQNRFSFHGVIQTSKTWTFLRHMVV